MKVNLSRQQKIKLLQDISNGKSDAYILMSNEERFLSVALIPKDELSKTLKALCEDVGYTDEEAEKEIFEFNLQLDSFAESRGYKRNK